MSRLTDAIANYLHDSNKEIVHDSGNWYTAQQVHQDVQRLCSTMAASGVKQGERILVEYPNSYSFLITYLAILSYGAIAVPVNPSMPVAERQGFIERSNVRVGFMTVQKWNLLFGIPDHDDAAHAAVKLNTVFVSNADSERPHTVFTNNNGRWESSIVRSSENENLTIPVPDEDDVGVLLFTSGTTGAPKAVGLKHRHLFAAAQNVASAHELSSADTSYCVLPLFHINAQVVVLLSTCLSRGRLVLAEKFSAREFWPTIETHNISWVSVVPTIITILLNTPGPQTAPQGLRFVRSASAQLSVLHGRRFEQLFGIPVVQSYGMTEAASQICVNPLQQDKRKLGSVGLPVGVELQIVDDRGVPLAPQQTGNILIRGENVIDGYEETSNLNDFVDGWFNTGDVGYMDTEGYVFLTGRKKEIINRAGEKISPYEVEDVIRRHFDVSDAAVVGLPDALYGERVVAFAVLKDRLVPQDKVIEEIFELCRRTIAAFKCPSEIRIVDALPIGATGKVQRQALKTGAIHSHHEAQAFQM
ncbi:AMP-binding protein [Alicyclobacillus sp. SO9]|uniref:AMP-binding protein n=1 Tax=Alicyclobacillus sp. SO9 TaxID=2665646 RepID=UPI0018E889E8|nr:AMP-binding protein [Alicyclobacillus sp. SO9]QQE76879.1 AMP-binding protein [Alicyclobacillus sp. SO9]